MVIMAGGVHIHTYIISWQVEYMYRLNHAIEAFLGSIVPPLGLQPSGGIIDHTVKRPGYFYYLVTSWCTGKLR